MTKNLYFTIGSAPSDDANDAIMINADLFVSMAPTTKTTSTLEFLDRENAGNANTSVVLLHTQFKHKEVMQSVAEAMAGEPKDGFIVIADVTNGDFCNPNITGVTLDL